MNSGARRLHNAHDYDARLQHALRTVKVGAWYMDLVYGNRVWSRDVATLMGLPRDAALDHERMVEAIHPDDRERVRKVAQRALAEGSSFQSDCRVVWPDGSAHWVSVKGCVQLNKTGAPYCIEGVIEDIEERKRLEARLEESQRTMHSLISHLPGLVYRCRNDTQYTVDFVSEGVQSLTGYSRSEFTEHKIAYGDLIHPDDAEEVWSAIQAALAARRQYQLTYRIRTAPGDEKWVWEQGIGVYSPEGELQFLEGFVTDITERKRSEEDRERLEGRLRQAQKMEALGTLAGGIAHDFNNVLAAIRGNTSLALEDLPPDSPALTSLHEIKRSATRAADLVRQILAFSRQEAAQRRPIALEPVVEEALKLLRATLPSSIEMRSEFAPDLPNVLADATQIHQVIMNLGVNAAQAIDARPGIIHVQVDSVIVSSDAAGRKVALDPGFYVRVRVSDDGCGIDESMLERVYDPFFTTNPAGQGTGLGLSVVHGIMLTHEGSISIESRPGEGTTVTLCFPAAQEIAAADPGTAMAAPHGEGEHILYIDDEEALVFLAERALRRLGYQVTGCVDPSQALNLFRAHPLTFDFVVTDLSMPGMSGRDVARELLQIRPDVPIVLTSGYVRPEDVQSARRLGIHDVILKPHSIDDLARVVASALGGKSATGSTSRSRR